MEAAVICSHCKFESPASSKFCGKCGSPLPRACPSCAAGVPADFKFCNHCGADLTSESPPDRVAEETPTVAETETTQEEIKQVTALCCELLTPTTDRIVDPEVKHAALTCFIKLGQAEVGRYGGHVSLTPNQGFLALFGVPVAHEDHLQRAILAAFKLLSLLTEELTTVANTEAEGWAMRCGLETGSVVSGAIGDVVIGDCLKVATSLATHSQPGHVTVGSSAARALGSVAELTPQENLPTDLQGWHLQQPPDDDTRGVIRFHSRFFGRRRELAQLEQMYLLAQTGRGQIVSLIGEAGAGKSRLTHELHLRLRGQPKSLLRGRCRSYGTGVPYLPFVEIIRSTTGILESDSPSEIASKLQAAIGTGSEAPLPYLLSLLGSSEGIEELKGAEPLAVQHGIFNAMRQTILNASQHSVVFLEIEDLHWIDRTSEEFLASLIEVIPAARVILLTTSRPGYQPPWASRSYVEQIKVRPLNQDDSRRLVTQLIEEPGSEVVDELLERAGGNPLFLEELAFSLGGEGLEAGDTLPSTLVDVLTARLDQLPIQHKRLLQTASVLEEDIPLNMLSELFGDGAAIAPLIEDLVRMEFLFRSPYENDTIYQFRHALTRDAAYQGLLVQRRKALHARAASILKRRHSERLEDVYDRLVYHYPRAEMPEEAIRYFSLFAAQAASRNSHSEAADALRKALALTGKLGKEVRATRRIEVLLRLADSLLPLACFSETLERFEHHRESLEEIEDPTLTSLFHFWLAHTHTYLGNHEATERNANIAIKAAQEIQDEATEGKARYVLGREGFWSGRFEQGIENSLRAVVLLERSGEPWWQAQAYWVGGFNHFALGQFDLALAALERARDIGETLADYRLDTSWSIGFILTILGRNEEGLRECQRGAEGAKDPLNFAVATGFLGNTQLKKGDLDEALRLLENSLERLAEAGMKQLEAWFGTFFAEAHLASGRTELALQAAEQSITTADEVDFGYGQGLAHRTLGRIRRHETSFQAAQDELQQASDVFKRLSMPFEVATTTLELTRLALHEGHKGRSEELLKDAKDAFSQWNLDTYNSELEELRLKISALGSD